MKLTIGCPVYVSNELHIDFTQQMIASIKTKYPYDLVIVDNYSIPSLKTMVQSIAPYYYENTENSVAGGWNVAIKHAQENNSTYILFPNNDIVFHPECIDNLVAFAQQHPDAIMWTAAEHDNLRTLKSVGVGDSFDEHPHFSCFMMSLEGLEKLRKLEEGTGEPYPGLFDANLKQAYFEDNDMHNRILRAGMKTYKTASALFYHYGSRTIKTDDNLQRINKFSYEKNRRYLQDKWGIDFHGKGYANDAPERFKYKKPFNR